MENGAVSAKPEDGAKDQPRIALPSFMGHIPDQPGLNDLILGEAQPTDGRLAQPFVFYYLCLPFMYLLFSLDSPGFSS